jgi:hypothetical protein
MIIKPFSLQPFPSVNPLPNLKIVGEIARLDNRLILDYNLLGNLEEVAIAPASETPTRQHELWQETCFEFFLGIKNAPDYWEFNLSPAGDWNVYYFSNYRQGMGEQKAVTSLPFSVQMDSDVLSLSLNLNLAGIIPADQPWEVAISTVIKDNCHRLTYWALVHLGEEADFHRRDSFIIELF